MPSIFDGATILTIDLGKLLNNEEHHDRVTDDGKIWDTVYGDVHITNSDLNDLLDAAISENTRMFDAAAEGRKADAGRHGKAYHQALEAIYSDRFTSEEQASAWKVLD